MMAADLKGPRPTRRGRTSALRPVTRLVLWARAAGRCQYQGCNKTLIGDLISGAEDPNFGFVGHIVADTPTGPRGDAVRSFQLSDDVNNLMLLCHVHHKLIDVDEVAQHPEARLHAMKAVHEARVEIVTGITDDRASHVLRYAANIGEHESPVEYSAISSAMLPDRYPAEGRRTIDIEIRGLDRRDSEPEFWTIQRENLQSQFGKKVSERIQGRNVQHLSVFAFAPQPLLIELGRLLGDIFPADVYQPHRKPKSWRWAEDEGPMSFSVRRPTAPGGAVALVLALSATINDVRITDALGTDTAIWAIEANAPHNDIMRRKDDLARFSRLVRTTLNEIKASHGEDATIHLFPAVPVSAAVEVGRAWMPKADLPLVIYDQNRGGVFVKAFAIGM